MGIRQKFFLLAATAGIIMAVVSCIGYFTAYTNLEASVEQEMGRDFDLQELHVNLITLSGHIDEDEDQFALHWGN